MKQIILIITLIGLIFLTGCQVNTEIKEVNEVYVLETGEKIVDISGTLSNFTNLRFRYMGNNKELFGVLDGDELMIGPDLYLILEEEGNNIAAEDINYKFTEYNDYANYIKSDLEKERGSEFKSFGVYGGSEGTEQLRKEGKVYFVVFEHGDWDAVRYWAVEVNAETGELLKYEEVTRGKNDIDYSKLWWREL